MKSIDLNTKVLEKYEIKLFNEFTKLIWKDNIDQVNNSKKFLEENINTIFIKSITNLMRRIMGLDHADKRDVLPTYFNI